MKKIIIAMLILIIFLNVSLAQETILGISPSHIDLGNLKRGEKKLVTFTVISPTHEKILISLSSNDGDLRFLNKPSFKDKVYNFSDESTSNWVNFVKNPVELEPLEEKIGIKKGLVKGAREVPESAEPGFHLVRIIPYPASKPSITAPGTIGISVVTTAEVLVTFNVDGEAIRDGKIVDVIFNKYSGNVLEGSVLFKNTGTVTIKARITNITILNEDNSIVESVGNFGEVLVKPGEMTKMNFIINSQKIVGNKDYNVFAEVNYLTGKDDIITKARVPTSLVVLTSKEAKEIDITILITILIFLAILFLVYRKRRERS